MQAYYCKVNRKQIVMQAYYLYFFTLSSIHLFGAISTLPAVGRDRAIRSRFFPFASLQYRELHFYPLSRVFLGLKKLILSITALNGRFEYSTCIYPKTWVKCNELLCSIIQSPSGQNLLNTVY